MTWRKNNFSDISADMQSGTKRRDRDEREDRRADACFFPPPGQKNASECVPIGWRKISRGHTCLEAMAGQSLILIFLARRSGERRVLPLTAVEYEAPVF